MCPSVGEVFDPQCLLSRLMPVSENTKNKVTTSIQPPRLLMFNDMSRNEIVKSQPSQRSRQKYFQGSAFQFSVVCCLSFFDYVSSSSSSFYFWEAFLVNTCVPDIAF